MENDVYLQIRDAFKRGSTKEEAFKEICQQQDFDPPGDLTIGSWFERAHDDTLEEEIGEDHYKLLYSIIGQYAKFTCAIFHREVSGLNCGSDTFILNRFNLDIGGNTKAFEIFDSYNEKSRMLQSTIVKPAWDNFYFSTFIGDNRILLIRGDSGIDHLFLLDIDFSCSKCLVVDDFALDFICSEIIYDSADSTQFLLRGSANDNPAFICKGQVSGDRISLADQRIELGVKLSYCKLINDKLLTFQYEDGDLNLVEYDLNLNSARKLNEWPCSGELVSDIFENERKYVWSDKKLYVACQFYNRSLNFSIALFDIDSRTWSKMKFTGIGTVGALTIDEDDILIISVTENRYDKSKPTLKTIYHLSMRKPDKLRYLAWKAIRREALFFGSKLYENFSPQLPFNSEFRLFAEDG